MVRIREATRLRQFAVGIGSLASLLAVAAVVAAVGSEWQLFAAAATLLVLVGIVGQFVAVKFLSSAVGRTWRATVRLRSSVSDASSAHRAELRKLQSSTKQKSDTSVLTVRDGVARGDNVDGSTRHDRQALLSSKGYWAKKVRDDPNYRNWIVQYGQKVRSTEVRDILALAATTYKYSYSELCSALEVARTAKGASKTLTALRSDLWKPGLLALARLLYAQNLEPFDRFNSLALYKLVEKAFGLKAFSNGVDRSYYSDVLSSSGDQEHARRVLDLPEQNEARQLNQSFLRINTYNPAVNAELRGFEQWFDQLNEYYVTYGLAPVQLRSGNAAPFFRLSADTTGLADVDSGPMVSIIMPVYEPDEATDLAIDSLLRQTWRNIELIAVDDASPVVDADGQPTDYKARLQRWADLDERVRVVFCEENRGAYAVRNDGYDLARGEYVTVADKDDWHHPQKIQMQVEELIADPEKHANITNWVRVDEELRFQLRWGPDRVVHPSFASLMYRTAEIRRTLGYWDTVRKSGDGEFKFRFQQVYGVNLQPTFPLPLAFSLLGEGNLTSADLGLGYEDGRRRTYRESWTHWHELIAEGQEDPYLEKGHAERRFPAPHSFLPGRPTYADFDVVFVSEFGFEAGNTTALRNDIRACVDAGLRVAILPLKNGLIESASKRNIAPEISDLVHRGTVTRLALIDEVKAQLVIVRWPAIMETIPHEICGVRPEQVVVIANHMPYELGDERYSYDVQTITKNVVKLFHVRPTWVAESHKIRPYLVPLVPREYLSEGVWPGVIPSVAHAEHKVRDYSVAPIVGRHARDAAGKWPDTRQDFRNVYMNAAVGRVSILGGARSPLKAGFISKEELAEFEVHEFKSLEPRDYLRNLDFFIYFHSRGLVEAFGMAIVEAMAAGVVCVLQPDFEPVFGDAAVYANPDEVEDTVRRLWNEGEYAAQQQRGWSFVTEQCSPSALLRRLHQFGVVPAEASTLGSA